MRGLDLAQHAIDTDCQLIERVVGAAGRQPLAQISCNNALDSPVNLRKPSLRPRTQRPADHDRQRERRQQTERQRTPDNLRELADLVVVPADRKNVAVRQRLGDEPHLFGLAAAIVGPHNRSVAGNVGREPAWHTLDIARNTMAVGPEQSGDPDAVRIVPQPIADMLELPRAGFRCDDVQLTSNQIVEVARHVGRRLPIDEAEQEQGTQDERPGDDERPAKRGRADEIRQAHGG